MRYIGFLLVAATLASGCSSGVNGDKGLVRFSFVGLQPEGADTTTPIATHTTLRVALQHPKGAAQLTDNDTYVQLHLVATAVTDGDDVAVFPTGFAEYGVYFAVKGTYRLVAMNGEEELDSVTMTVDDPDRLEFTGKVTVVTSDGNCVDSEQIELGAVDLAENQTASFAVVERKGAVAMLGLPALVADTTAGSLTTLPSSFSIEALNLRVRPGAAGTPMTITAQDLGNDLKATVTFKTHAGRAPVECQ